MNRKMIAHILAKMLGVEALLDSSGNCRSDLSRKKCGVFSAADHLLTLIYLIG